MSEPRASLDAAPLLAHATFVRAMARGVLGADDLVDDAVQETWLAAFRGGPRDAGRLRSWLGSVARRRALDLRRREAARARHEASAETTAPEELSPDRLAERAEMGRRLVAALLALEEPYRGALLLRYYEDLAPPDVAKRLGVPLETARTRLKRGLERLRRALDGDDEEKRRAYARILVPWVLPEDAAEPGGARARTRRLAVVAAALGTMLLVGAYVLTPAFRTSSNGDGADGGDAAGSGARGDGAAARTAGGGGDSSSDSRRAGRADRADAPGGGDDGAAGAAGGAGATTTPAELTVSGVVRDPDGKPVPFLGVRWTLRPEGERDAGPAKDAHTDADGRYEIRGLVPGDLSVFFLSERGLGEPVDFDVRLEKSMTRDVELHARLRLAGRVVLPAPGPAELWLDFHQEFAGGLSTGQWDVRHLTLPADGTFELNALRPGAYVLHVTAPGCEQYDEEIRMLEDVRGHVIRPRRGVPLNGRVVAAEGLAPGEAWIWITPEDGARGQEMLRCESDGSFSMPSAAPGRYRVFVRWTVETDEWATHTERTVTVEQTDPPTPIEIRVLPDVEMGLRVEPPEGVEAVAGRVTVVGSPAEDPHVIPFAARRDAAGKVTTQRREAAFIFPPPRWHTDEGLLRLDGMPQGSYVVRVEALGCVTVDRRVAVTAPATVDVSLVRRAGRVVTARLPSEYFRVEARRVGETAWTTVVWEDGRLHISHRATPGEPQGFLAPGRYEFRAVGDTIADTTAGPIDVEESGPPLVVTFTVRPGVSITGAVTNTAGAAISGARLHVFRVTEGVEDAGARRLEEKETSVEEGRYAIRGLVAGRYRIAATDTGEPLLAEVVVEGADVVRDLTLAR